MDLGLVLSFPLLSLSLSLYLAIVVWFSSPVARVPSLARPGCFFVGGGGGGGGGPFSLLLLGAAITTNGSSHMRAAFGCRVLVGRCWMVAPACGVFRAFGRPRPDLGVVPASGGNGPWTGRISSSSAAAAAAASSSSSSSTTMRGVSS